MKIQSSFRIFLVVLSLCALQPSVKSQDRNTSFTATVKAYRTNKKRVLFKLSYTYDFGGREGVYIDTIGMVPGKGTFTYFSTDPHVQFKESANGRVISKVALLGPEVFTAVSMEAEFPEDTQYGEAYRSGIWVSPLSFQQVTNKILNGFSPSGYRAYQKDNVSYSQTTYLQLNGLPGTLSGEVALLVSQPHSPSSNTFEYHVKYVARERRFQSGAWRNTLSRETKSSAERLLDEFLKKIADEERPAK